jgi:hypothetical protein
VLYKIDVQWVIVSDVAVGGVASNAHDLLVPECEARELENSYNFYAAHRKHCRVR